MFKFLRMNNAPRSLLVTVPHTRNKRTVEWVNESNGYRKTPGELSEPQWRHLKIEPSKDLITDMSSNLGKLVRYSTLAESLAEMVENKV